MRDDVVRDGASDTERRLEPFPPVPHLMLERAQRADETYQSDDPACLACAAS